MMGKLNGCIFLIEDDVLLENYNTIWDKVSANIIKNYSKTKVKSHGDEATDFQDKKIIKLDSNYTCLAVISLDSALKKDDNYYPQVFLKECEYIEKRHINDNLSDFSSSSDESDGRINWSGLFFL